jgi:hypothetical protein
LKFIFQFDFGFVSGGNGLPILGTNSSTIFGE